MPESDATRKPTAQFTVMAALHGRHYTAFLWWLTAPLMLLRPVVRVVGWWRK